jgi:hypothetical protein
MARPTLKQLIEGRDFYPTSEQLARLKAGETVVRGLNQWA